MNRPEVTLRLLPSYRPLSQTIPLLPFFFAAGINLFSTHPKYSETFPARDILCVTATKLGLFVIGIANILLEMVNSLLLIVWLIASSHRSQLAWSTTCWPLSLSAKLSLSVIMRNVCVSPYNRLQTRRLPLLAFFYAPDISFCNAMNSSILSCLTAIFLTVINLSVCCEPRFAPHAIKMAKISKFLEMKISD